MTNRCSLRVRDDNRAERTIAYTAYTRTVRNRTELGLPADQAYVYCIVRTQIGHGRLRDATALLPQRGRAMAEIASQRNLVLSSLSPADFALLEPNLEPVDLPVRKLL